MSIPFRIFVALLGLILCAAGVLFAVLGISGVSRGEARSGWLAGLGSISILIGGSLFIAALRRPDIVEKTPIPWKKILIPLSLLGLYFITPVTIGYFDIGNKAGPKIYPIQLHTYLYLLGNRLGGHPEPVTRIGFTYRSDLRPWFYGLKSGNQ